MGVSVYAGDGEVRKTVRRKEVRLGRPTCCSTAGGYACRFSNADDVELSMLLRHLLGFGTRR